MFSLFYSLTACASNSRFVTIIWLQRWVWCSPLIEYASITDLLQLLTPSPCMSAHAICWSPHRLARSSLRRWWRTHRAYQWCSLACIRSRCHTALLLALATFYLNNSLHLTINNYRHRPKTWVDKNTGCLHHVVRARLCARKHVCGRTCLYCIASIIHK